MNDEGNSEPDHWTVVAIADSSDRRERQKKTSTGCCKYPRSPLHPSLFRPIFWNSELNIASLAMIKS